MHVLVSVRAHVCGRTVWVVGHRYIKISSCRTVVGLNRNICSVYGKASLAQIRIPRYAVLDVQQCAQIIHYYYLLLVKTTATHADVEIPQSSTIVCSETVVKIIIIIIRLCN